MPTKTRFIIVCILILLGAASFSYCAFCYPKNTIYLPSITNPETGQVSTSNTETNNTGSPGKPRPKIGAT